MKTKAYRHGEILFVETNKIPSDLKEKKTDTLMIGSGNNSHTFKNGKFYEIKNNPIIIGYFESKNSKLYHPEHGNKKIGSLKESSLPDGIYEVRKGKEFINKELKPIID